MNYVLLLRLEQEFYPSNFSFVFVNDRERERKEEKNKLCSHVINMKLTREYEGYYRLFSLLDSTTYRNYLLRWTCFEKLGKHLLLSYST